MNNLLEFFPPATRKFFSNGDHIKLEKYDNDNDFDKITSFINQGDDNKYFFWYHVKMTSPVFGEWNYVKYLKEKI